MSTHYTRAAVDAASLDADAGTPIHFVASSQEPKRDSYVTRNDRWQLDNFRRNPVAVWAHQYTVPPIGRVEADITERGLEVAITFDPEDELARTVESKYRRGFLNAVSVGWDDVERDGETWHDLWEVSAVPVPADPGALIDRQRAALSALGRELIETAEQERKAIPPHETDKADRDAEWDAGAEVKAAEGAEQLRRMHAWLDPDGDADAKATYKFPHHTAGGEVVFRALAAAAARLDQADIDDKDGVRAHLARHYRQFDEEPPWARAVDEPEGGDGVGYLDVPEWNSTISTAAEWTMTVTASDGETSEVIWVGPVRQAEPDGETWGTTAAAMVEVFVLRVDDTDEARQARYNALLPAYRRHGKTAPEFLTCAELAALGCGSDEWFGLWLHGEAQRYGATLAEQNAERLREAWRLLGETLGELPLDEFGPVDGSPDEDEPDADVDLLRQWRQAVTPDTLAEWRTMFDT